MPRRLARIIRAVAVFAVAVLTRPQHSYAGSAESCKSAGQTLPQTDMAETERRSPVSDTRAEDINSLKSDN